MHVLIQVPKQTFKMENKPRICSCIEKSIPLDEHSLFDIVTAYRERPKNLLLDGLSTKTKNRLDEAARTGNMLLISFSPEDREQLFELKLSKNEKWSNGKTLRVRFINGSEFLQNKVKEFAPIWARYANLDFKFVESGETEIRVSFNPDGRSWSYIGTDCDTINQNEPTMNFGWFDETTSDFEFKRTILHEFGHAIGCTHEHQGAGIPWNKEAVYKYYQESQNWTQQQVDDNIINKYSRPLTNSVYDSQSIMHYPIDAALLDDASYAVGLNADLSEEDKEFIASIYPGRPPYDLFVERIENLK
ncbi:M12 family metallopeptidase [Hymenobacter sp. ASUV-10]|uniref:M12 family metallopeptidase n=1 Tax=Hymenobacter aranciens TaxID=3063996 RepID=A0ABT9BBA4_9BACT|nr:M12 family metallopeptidase [Hymenobacter sp. ASUV-10]MDO7874302.1 M12 family metallopeptidase [Hymenobacter sp. ASUV-10]